MAGTQCDEAGGQQPDTQRQDQGRDQSNSTSDRDRTQAIQREEQARNRENQHDDVGGPPNSRE